MSQAPADDATVARRGMRIGFAVLGAPLAWVTQEWLGWWIAGRGCSGFATVGDGSANVAARAWQLGLGSLALIVALLSLTAAWRGRRRLSHEAPASSPSSTAGRFLAAAAIFSSVAFVIGILWTLLATAVLPVCEVMR